MPNRIINRLSTILFLALAWINLTTFLLAKDEPSKNLYNIKDLAISSQDGQYLTFYQHLYDLPPSKRTKEWEELFKKTTQKFLTELSKEKLNYFSEVLNVLVKEKLVNNDATISYQVHENYIDWISTGVERKEPVQMTLHKIDNYLPFMTKNPVLRMKLFNSIKELSFAKLTDYLIPIIAPVLKSNVSQTYCQDHSVQNLIFPQLLSLSKNFKESKKEFDVEISKIMNLACWKSFQARVQRKLYQNDYRDYMHIIENDLTFPREDKLFAQLRYLLEAPAKSDFLNESYNALMILSKNQVMREKVALKFKKFTHLPDETLSMKSKQLRSLSLSLIQALSRIL